MTEFFAQWFARASVMLPVVIIMAAACWLVLNKMGVMRTSAPLDGSDMTEVEQTLVEPLQTLKSADYSRLLRIALGGLGGTPSAHEQAALTRLQLTRPTSLADHAYRLLLLGALRSG